MASFLDELGNFASDLSQDISNVIQSAGIIKVGNTVITSSGYGSMPSYSAPAINTTPITQSITPEENVSSALNSVGNTLLAVISSPVVIIGIIIIIAIKLLSK
ncbi:MAG: hypothetical protein QXJ93_01015 [Candidatus Rehaiarchaeum fermentans]|nr:hypothetical protein [Candidatus Rehaiarchaeum fermentans]